MQLRIEVASCTSRQRPFPYAPVWSPANGNHASTINYLDNGFYSLQGPFQEMLLGT
ncbi:MAG TPA: hypothetical protein PKZ51_13270 [Saprospiraceae bacterium]|nr:hypothetical protein [Saprospiraceae bacterium]